MTPKELKNIRKERGLNQKEMALLLNASYSALTKWETAANPIPKWVEEKLVDRRKGFALKDLTAAEIAEFEEIVARKGGHPDAVAAELVRWYIKMG